MAGYAYHGIKLIWDFFQWVSYVLKLPHWGKKKNSVPGLLANICNHPKSFAMPPLWVDVSQREVIRYAVDRNWEKNGKRWISKFSHNNNSHNSPFHSRDTLPRGLRITYPDQTRRYVGHMCLDPLPRGFNPPTPSQFFPPYSRPLFPYFFSRYLRPKFRFFVPALPPLPIFRQKPPLPPSLLSSPTDIVYRRLEYLK